MSTKENLEAAFAGESQANRRYTAFALKADAEGLPQVARLFRAAAAAGEAHEFQEMYPAFLAQATAEGNKAAAMNFEGALAVEKIHHALYTAAQAAVQAGQDLPAKPLFVCDVCGNTIEGQPPDTCPICGAKRERFIEVK